MAPEQSTGGTVTGAADVFALGGVLAFCRTGEPPFGTPPVPTRERDDETLHAVIAACLDADPVRRPTVEEVAAALSAKGTDGGTPPARMVRDIAARPVGTRLQAPRYGRRRALLQLSGAVGAALTGMGAVRAAVGAEPPAAPVLWTARGTVVTGDGFGPLYDGGLYLLDRTVVTRSGDARLELCHLDAATGRHRWRSPLAPFERGRGTVTAALGTVWVRSRDELLAVAPGTGAVRWTRRRKFAGPAPATACGDTLVYDVADSGDAVTLYAHEPGTGRVVWRARSMAGPPARSPWRGTSSTWSADAGNTCRRWTAPPGPCGGRPGPRRTKRSPAAPTRRSASPTAPSTSPSAAASSGLWTPAPAGSAG
ncbi:hypothetical protein BJF79_32330 [Actinomadura sp. CNU-125]|nr:hypothetical protein BJF79_32330 [Actinomadura sp. CNU-125]